MDLSVVWLVLATAVVVLLAVLTTFLIQTLVEVRTTVRELRTTLAKLAPDLELTLANARRASDTVARAGEALGQIPTAAEGLHGLRSRAAGSAPLLAGIVAALKVGRWLFSGRRRDSRTTGSRR